MTHVQPLSRATIQSQLRDFAARWEPRDGHEQQEAQAFLSELLQVYGVDWAVPGQKSPFEFQLRIEGATKRADLLIPDLLLVEMKSASETGKLKERHEAQLLRYWEHTPRQEEAIRKPRFAVLCSFKRFIFYELAYGDRVRADVTLTELVEQPELLDFLRGEAVHFDRKPADLAKDAVDAVAQLHESLRNRGVAAEDARNFTMQATWCMFAEDLGMFDENHLTDTVEELLSNEALQRFNPIAQLFAALNTPGAKPAPFSGVPFANGGLFAVPSTIQPTHDELELMFKAARADWRLVQPAIFGGLLQSALGEERRKRMGAHYTPELEIQKIVGPTISRPWRARIDAVATLQQARELLDELVRFRVLDPACGCGNFLYVTYRELRSLERLLRDRIAELAREAGRAVPADLPSVPLDNMLGIEQDPFGVALARVVLWIGHKLAVEEFDLPDAVLPLPAMSGIQQGDALHVDWPACEAIVGNPPFHGSQNLRALLGDEELAWLQQSFGIGIKDYCVYWFRKAHAHLDDGERAGLVGTNSISQNRARKESLEAIVADGGVITDAISTQVWPGDAAVHVSIVNWVKRPGMPVPELRLDGEPVHAISPSLRASSDLASAARLKPNAGRAFQGAVPGASGFVIDLATAQALLNEEPAAREVIRPYLTGRDMVETPGSLPTRDCIFFGTRSLEEAAQFPRALAVVESEARVARESSRSFSRNPRWWQFLWPRPHYFEAAGSMRRALAGTATGKRILFAWQTSEVCPSNAVNVFTFDDDYSFGVLSSRVHTDWARAQSSTLKGDIRYTPTTAFETFSWPMPGRSDHDRISDVAKRLHVLRQERSSERQIGLTRLYNELDDGAHVDLRTLHRELDEAVCAAYGWPSSLVDDDDERNRRLLELNRAINAGEMEYAPFPERDHSGTEAMF